MSYIDKIIPEKINDFEIISYWDKYLNECLREKKEISGFEHFGDITISNKIIESEVLFSGKYSYGIRFEYCYFKKSINFSLAHFSNNVSISNSYIDESISTILPSTFEDHFFIVSTKVKTLLILDGKFNKCIWEILDCKACYLFKADFQILNLVIGEGGVEDLRLGSPDITGQLNISGNGNRINKLTLENISNNVNISLEDLEVEELLISKCRNESGLRFSNIKSFSKKGQFSISNSNLGSAEFYSVDFTTFGEVTMSDCSLINSVFVNTKFPNNIDAFNYKKIEESSTEKEFKNTILELEKRKTPSDKKIGKYNNEVIQYYRKKREHCGK